MVGQKVDIWEPLSFCLRQPLEEVKLLKPTNMSLKVINVILGKKKPAKKSSVADPDP